MFLYPLTSSYNPNIGFDIKARKKIYDEVQEGISIQIINIIDTGTYILNSNSSIGSFGIYYNIKNNCSYSTDSTQVGIVDIIKLDVPNKIIAGTFEMKLWKERM